MPPISDDGSELREPRTHAERARNWDDRPEIGFFGLDLNAAWHPIFWIKARNLEYGVTRSTSGLMTPANGRTGGDTTAGRESGAWRRSFSVSSQGPIQVPRGPIPSADEKNPRRDDPGGDKGTRCPIGVARSSLELRSEGPGGSGWSGCLRSCRLVRSRHSCGTGSCSS